jgi:hypothetical protein
VFRTFLQVARSSPLRSQFSTKLFWSPAFCNGVQEGSFSCLFPLFARQGNPKSRSSARLTPGVVSASVLCADHSGSQGLDQRPSSQARRRVLLLPPENVRSSVAALVFEYFWFCVCELLQGEAGVVLESKSSRFSSSNCSQTVIS